MKAMASRLKICSVVLLLTCCVGCPVPGSRQPEIRIERVTTGSRSELTVRYFYHYNDPASHCNSKAILDTPEKLRDYKLQVLALLKQIEEVEAAAER